MRRINRSGNSGFTLIEVIAALVLIAFAGLMLVLLVSRSASGVHRPRELLGEAYSLQATMENIVARSRELGNLDQLAVEVGTEGSAMNNQFGRYDVVHNRFVAYNTDGDEVAASTNTLLKIAVRNTLGETLIRLFSR